MRAARRTVIAVAAANGAYFVVEFAAALAIGSVALFADSVDFLEDAALNLLVALGLGWSVASRVRLGRALAALILVPALATLWAAWSAFSAGQPPHALTLTTVGLGALAVNLGCALALTRHRAAPGALMRAAFLSARNDALANVAIIAAGLVTAFLWRSVWPDLIVGLGVFALNADAAAQVWRAAGREGREGEGATP